MDEKWRVSRVELLEGGLLYGFVLYDQKAGRVFRSAGPRESEVGPQSCCGGADGRRASSRSVSERANSERQEGADLLKKG